MSMWKSKYLDYRKAAKGMYDHLYDHELSRIIEYREGFHWGGRGRSVQVYVTGVGNVPMAFPNEDKPNYAACVVANLRQDLVFPFAIHAYDDNGIIRIVKRHGDKSVVASVFIPKKI